VNVHHLYYKGTIQEKAITLNVKKLRAALLTEGELIEGNLVEQVEEDGLVALAKRIISRAEEKISLESELRRLRGFEEESDMILPDNSTLEDIPDEVLPETSEEVPLSEATNEEARFDRETEVAAPREPMTEKSGSAPQHASQLVLFSW